MNTVKSALLALSFILVCSASALAADATPLSAKSFGIVDMNRVLKMTDVAKDIFGQLEAKRKEYQSSISKEEGGLRAAEQELVKQKDSLSKDAFDKKRKEFEEKVMSGQKLVQDRKHTLDQAFNSSMNSLRNEAAKIVAEIAKERSYAVVFTQDAVMMSTPELDMTDVVIERMNKNVKKIQIDWSAAGGPDGKKK